MNCTPVGISPDEPHALVIIKPGYDAIKFGPLPGITAGAWEATLRSRLYQAPVGTTIEVVSFDPESGTFIDPNSIPRTVEDLIAPLRADPGHPANGGFPDLFHRLVLVHGETRAGEIWDQACRQVDDEAAFEQAEHTAAADRTDAADLVGRAHALAQQAGQKIINLLKAADALDLDAVPVGRTQDARDHVQTAARELRAAARALGGER
jgi:hypothetical protein